MGIAMEARRRGRTVARSVVLAPDIVAPTMETSVTISIEVRCMAGRLTPPLVEAFTYP